MNKVKRMSLNKFGTIEIVRGNGDNKMKLFCPFRRYKDPKTGRDEAAFCSHECSLFPEPTYEDNQVIMKLCQQQFVCDEKFFTDERE